MRIKALRTNELKNDKQESLKEILVLHPQIEWLIKNKTTQCNDFVWACIFSFDKFKPMNGPSEGFSWKSNVSISFWDKLGWMEPHIVCEIRTGILFCVLILCRERRSSCSSMRRSSWRRTSLCSSKSSSWVAPSAICSHTRSRRQSSTPSGPRSLRQGWPTPGMWPGTSSSGGQP